MDYGALATSLHWEEAAYDPETFTFYYDGSAAPDHAVALVGWDDAKVVTEHNLATERYAGYRARKQTHVHKLAMILAACKSDRMEITLEDLSEALELVTSVEPYMQRVFESIGVSQASRYAGEILAIVKAYKRIDRQKVWRLVFNTMSGKDFVEAIGACVSAGYIRLLSEKGNTILVWSTHVKEVKKDVKRT